MVGVVTDHPVFVFCQRQAVRVLVAGRFQTGSSKAFNAMLALEKKVLLCRSVGDNTNREQKTLVTAPVEVPTSWMLAPMRSSPEAPSRM